MARLSEDQKNYRRAIIILLIGIFAAVLAMIKSGLFFDGGLIYIAFGVSGIVLYMNWDKLDTGIEIFFISAIVVLLFIMTNFRRYIYAALIGNIILLIFISLYSRSLRRRNGR